MRLPVYVKHCFWSYSPSDFDLRKDKELIIAQILNYGDWRGIRWLFQNYSEREIKAVLVHPRRGSWWPKVLNFWLTIFKLRIPKDTRALAIREIDPAKVDQKALLRFFRWARKPQ